MVAAWKWVKLIGLIVGIGGVIGVLHLAGFRWSDVTPERVRNAVLAFGWWAPALYMFFYAQPVIPLPASIMMMAAGLSFGLVGGFVAALTAALIRGCGQFLLARVCGREAIESFLKGRLATFDQYIGRNAFLAVLWIRLVPNVPYDIQNFALGFSRVPFGAFALATCIGLVPGVCLWVYLGHTLADAAQLWKVVGVLLGLAALWYLRYRPRTRQARAPS